MKTEMKILIALLSVFSIGLAGLSLSEVDAKIFDQNMDEIEESREYDGNLTAEIFNTYVLLDKDNKTPLFEYDVYAQTTLNTLTPSTSSFSLDYSMVTIHETYNYDEYKGYTATNIQVTQGGEEKYSKLYYEVDEDNNIIGTYWMFNTQFTLSEPGKPAFNIYSKDVLSRITVLTNDVVFDNTYHTVLDAIASEPIVKHIEAKMKETGLSFEKVKYVDQYITPIPITVGNTGTYYYMPWKIVAKSLNDAVEAKQLDISIGLVSQDTFKKKDVNAISVTITDRMKPLIVSDNYSLSRHFTDDLVGDYYISNVDWKALQITITGINKIDNHKKDPLFGNPIQIFTDNGNYKDSIVLPFEVAPSLFQGTAHVNIIQSNGFLSVDTFTDANTFIYPNVVPTYTYVQDKDGKPVLRLVADNDFPPVERSNCKIVVRDASGNIVIDEVAGITSGFTFSEWNYIEIYGVNEYSGYAAGSFYLSFAGTPGLLFQGNAVIGYAGVSSDVVIPDYYDGYKITKIADKAFINNKTIESVTISDKVTAVGMKAFANCSNLKSVVFGDSVKVISYYAFFGCKSLCSIDFDSKIIAIRTNAFKDTIFQDVEGNALSATAANLAGKYFEGSNGVLKITELTS